MQNQGVPVPSLAFQNLVSGFKTRRTIVPCHPVRPLPVICVTVLSALLAIAAGPQPVRYDTLITNGLLFDGSGRPAARADLAIKDGRIAAIGQLAGATATQTIDASTRYVTPGFIDVHSHAAEGLTHDGLQQGQPLLAQGVTTIVANPDGGGPIDLKAQKVT